MLEHLIPQQPLQGLALDHGRDILEKYGANRPGADNAAEASEVSMEISISDQPHSNAK